jgi:hypothetical protein
MVRQKTTLETFSLSKCIVYAKGKPIIDYSSYPVGEATNAFHILILPLLDKMYRSPSPSIIIKTPSKFEL